MNKRLKIINACGEATTRAEILVSSQLSETPEISIIVPVYNVELYLEDCLNCITAQTYKNIEIICINDGSTDNSLNILLQYAKKDKRFTVITQKNSYAGTARNAGITVAKGKYFLFFDADDFMELDTLEKMYQCIESTHADICIANADFYDNENKIFRGKLLFSDLCPRESVFSMQEIGKNIYNFCTQIVWNKLVSRQLIEKYHLRFQSLKSCNDTAFGYLMMSLADNFAVIDEKLIHYRQKHNNHISSARGKTAIGIIKAFQYIKELLEKEGKSSMIPLLIESFKKHIRYEISCCSLKEYSAFKTQTQELLKNDFTFFKSEFVDDFETIENPVIISLTSFPARIDTVFRTIISLKNQIKCDKIVLYLGKDKFKNVEIPPKLADLIDDYFEIHWIEKDLRSFTKLIPALKEYPDAIIVTADDDILYPNGWLTALLRSYIKYPKDIHCHRVHRMILKNSYPIPYSDWKQEYSVAGASYLNFLTGVGGVLYPPHIFNDEVFNKVKYKGLTPYADDIWFWAMAVNSAVRLRCIEGAKPKLKYVPGTQTEVSLLNLNNGLNRNDVQLKAVLNAYPKILRRLYWEVWIDRFIKVFNFFS